MLKIAFIFKEMFYMVKRHKVYFLAPILFALALLIFLAFYIGPSAVIAFIYAGI